MSSCTGMAWSSWKASIAAARWMAPGPSTGPTGSLMRSGTFDRGRQIGVWQTFDRSGKLVKETDFGQAS